MEKRKERTAGKKAAGPSLVADYTLLPGIPDEMIGPDGQVRPVWRKLIERCIAHEFSAWDRTRS